VFEQLPERLEKRLRQNPPPISRFRLNLAQLLSASVTAWYGMYIRRVFNKAHGHFVKLHDFLQQTGILGDINFALPAEWVGLLEPVLLINTQAWGRINRARKIDTQIANELHHLEDPPFGKGASVINTFSERLPKEVLEPRLTCPHPATRLSYELASGENVAAEMAIQQGVGPMAEDQIVEGPHKDILTNPKYGLRGNTPLGILYLEGSRNNGSRFRHQWKES